MRFQILGIQAPQVFCGSPAFIDGVGAVGISHILKGFIVLNQLVHQHLSIIEMNVIIPGAMDVEEVSLQILRITDR